MIEIVPIDTPSLGDRGYLVTDGSAALVIDPQRDIDRITSLAAERRLRITDVFETHIHNDYITGGLALAREAGAAYHVNAADPVSFDRSPIIGGDVIESGSMRIRAIATPGHTFTHLSYAVAEVGRDSSQAGQVIAVCTGGSMLNGATGRTDLLGPQHRVELAKAQHGSVRRLAAELPGTALVCPTHGFGSFCSATPTTGTSSTISAEIKVNPALVKDEADFVETTLAGLDAYPAYYAQMAPANATGPLAPVLEPPRQVASGELRRRIGAGEWVVDLRSRIAFAAGHLRGALQFELGDSMVTYLGWLMPWGTPLTLIGETAADVAAAQRELVRIGIDKLEAAACGAPPCWAAGEQLAGYQVTDFAGYAVARGHRELVLLDVRRDSEWKSARIGGAVHIPLHELPGRLADVPDGEVWVHCHSGYRASVAASLLDAVGRQVVLIDDDFLSAQSSGLASQGVVPAY